MAKLERKDLEAVGRLWVKYIKEEARKDAKKSTFIPRDREFYNSFEYKIETGGIVAIYSSWPWLDLITEGTKGPYKMKWLTHQKGVDVVPIAQADGTMALRTTPLTIARAWVHPKIAKHTFINRAYERAVTEQLDKVLDKAFDAASSKR